MSGKWDDPSVPKKGWECEDIEVLDDVDAICEMCEVKEIRFVHIVHHPNYPDSLRVGCKCSAKMELDPTKARIREKKMQNSIARKRKWLSRKWKKSEKGNDYVKTEGLRVGVYQANGKWVYCIVNDKNEQKFFPKQNVSFDTSEKAKLAAFDRLMLLTDHFTKDANELNKY